MTPKNAQELFGEFPRLLIRMNESDLEYTPDGWSCLIRRMCREIEEELIRQGGDFRGERWLKLIAIEETREGRLSALFDDADDLNGWDMKAVEALIGKAAEKAVFICKSCGRSNPHDPSERRDFCPECEQKFEDSINMICDACIKSGFGFCDRCIAIKPKKRRFE